MEIETARAAMKAYVATLNAGGGVEVRATGYEERIEGGWAFSYNSAEYLDTGRFETQLVGQGPTLVLDDGTILEGGSAERPQDVLDRYGR
jgi:hypothetical protein